jgi:demethylmenaquinone methyltransferase/2-methoxy-6-polyprenyl-1,4-benzoquinol methylase
MQDSGMNIISLAMGKKMERLEEKKRQTQINNSPKSADETYFGYERISTVAKTDRVIQHFNSVARHYDFMNTLLSFGIHYAWKRTAVRMLKLAPGDYDINRAMIKAGLHKVINTEIETRLWHVQGDAECISFPGRHFDAAMVGFGIRNVTHMQKGFEEMYRALKPGGKLMCLEFSKPTWPVFRWLYDFYSFYIMPFIGELLVGSKKAYTHLPESIRMFPLPNELSNLLKKIGFSQITYRRLTNGIAVIHLAVK